MTPSEPTPNPAVYDAVDAVQVYWRPGCPYCARLRRGLRKLGIDTVEYNIWDDPADAAIVRRHANGNETVPTVVIGQVGMVNPSAKQIAGRLAATAPHLLSDQARALIR